MSDDVTIFSISSHHSLGIVLLVILSGTQTCQSVRKIQSSVFKIGHLVKEGKTVILSCPSFRPWFLCVWHSPLTEKQCAVRMKGRLDTVCSNQRFIIFGNDTQCDIEIKTTAQDHGDWTCLLTLDSDYESQRSQVSLKVVLRPQVSLQLTMAGTVTTVDSQSSEPVPTLHMIEGQTKEVMCRADRAFPRPSFHWTLDSEVTANNSNNTISMSEPLTTGNSNKPRILMEKEKYWDNISHSVQVESSISQHRKLLTCHVVQHDRFGQLLDHVKVSLDLQVHPLLPAGPYHQPTPSKFPIIPLLIGALLPILCLCLCLILGIRLNNSRRKENDQQPVFQHTLSLDSDQSVSEDMRHSQQHSPAVFASQSRRVSVIGKRYRDISKEEHMQYINGGTCENNKITFQPHRLTVPNNGNSVLSTGACQSLEEVQANVSLEPSPKNHPISLRSLSFDKPLRAAYGSSTLMSEPSQLTDPISVPSLSFDNPFQAEDESCTVPVSEVQSNISPESPQLNDQISAPSLSFDNPLKVEDGSFTVPVSEVDAIMSPESSILNDPISLPSLSFDKPIQVGDESFNVPVSEPVASFTLFYCKEGCFSDKSKCTHQRVSLPLFGMHS